MLAELLECEEEKAEKITEIFRKATGGEIECAKLLPSEKKARLLKVKSGGTEYFLRVSSKNVLKEIREGEEKGTIRYQVNY